MNNDKHKFTWQELIRILFLVLTAAGIFIVVYKAFFGNTDIMFQAMLQEHFKAVVGLPAAALTSFFLVLILKQTAGPIKFKGLSFEFEGTSGEVMLWIACFLSMVYSIDKLW